MELLRNYHAMFWAFFFFYSPPSSTLSLIQYLFFTATFLENVSCAFKKKCLVQFSCLTHLIGSKAKSLKLDLGTAEQVFQGEKKKIPGKKYFSFLTLLLLLFFKEFIS